MMPDINSLLNIPSLQNNVVPKREEIVACASTNEIKKLNDSTTQSFKPRNFIPIPPFLVWPIQAAVRKYSGDPDSILLEAINASKEFNSTHQEDNDYEDKALLKCRNLFYWLFLAGKNDNIIEKIKKGYQHMDFPCGPPPQY